MTAKYYIGVDTSDNEMCAYCLGREVNGVFELLLTNVRADKNEFEEEVRNLAQYFNADITRES